jgi:hypothetical protein
VHLCHDFSVGAPTKNAKDAVVQGDYEKDELCTQIRLVFRLACRVFPWLGIGGPSDFAGNFRWFRGPPVERNLPSGNAFRCPDGRKEKRANLQREVGRDSIQVQVFQQTFFEIINPAVHHHRLVFSPRLLDDFSITRSANLSHDV